MLIHIQERRPKLCRWSICVYCIASLSFDCSYVYILLWAYCQSHKSNARHCNSIWIVSSNELVVSASEQFASQSYIVHILQRSGVKKKKSNTHVHCALEQSAHTEQAKKIHHTQ